MKSQQITLKTKKIKKWLHIQETEKYRSEQKKQLKELRADALGRKNSGWRETGQQTPLLHCTPRNSFVYINKCSSLLTNINQIYLKKSINARQFGGTFSLLAGELVGKGRHLIHQPSKLILPKKNWKSGKCSESILV